MMPTSLVAFVYRAAPIARYVLFILLTEFVDRLQVVTSPLCVLVPRHQRPSPSSVVVHGLIPRRTSLPVRPLAQVIFLSALRADSPMLALNVCLCLSLLTSVNTPPVLRVPSDLRVLTFFYLFRCWCRTTPRRESSSSQALVCWFLASEFLLR